MNILITDDEKPARDHLSNMIEKIPGCHTVGYAENGIEAVYKTFNLAIDVVFMDIRLPKLNGMDAAHHINSAKNPPTIIFTTSFVEHSLEAHGTHPAGYLLKPISFVAVEEVLSHIQRTRQRTLSEPTSDFNQERNYIGCFHQGTAQLIPLNQVYYFQALKKYTHIYYNNGVTPTVQSLLEIESSYTELLRIHRGFLINKNYLRRLEFDYQARQYQIRMHGISHPLPVSRRNLPTVRRFVRSFMQPAKEIKRREESLNKH